MKTRLINENFKSDYLKNLLIARGIKEENFELYLHPTKELIEDWRDFDNIQIGLCLLNTVLQDNGNILLIVDCDVDGYTSSSIIYQYLKDVKPDVKINYILHEHKAHGLEDCIEDILNSDIHYDLVILPDSSSNDCEYHEKLISNETKVLVLDHHDLEDNIPIASGAIIINNQLSNNYKNKELTGAGVTWQFCRAFDEEFGYNFAWNYIDLAALGVCADMASVLTLENRALMKIGFENIQNYFFKSAVEKQDYSMGGKINPTTVAFYIVPSMNAIIRVGTIEEKRRLFLGLIDGHKLVESHKRGARGTMEEVAIESWRECTNAKAKQNRITDQMVDVLDARIAKYDLLSNKVLFIRLEDEDDFPSEINGLIAMKLAAKYKRPTVVARLNDEGFDRGSIRNVSNCALTDLKKFLNESGFFEYVQGHPNAAGASILDKNLFKFHQYANEALSNINFLEGAYDVNFERLASNSDLSNLIFALGEGDEFWGQQNDEPLISITDINITQNDIQLMGAKKDTLKIFKNGISYIKFHAESMIEEIKQYQEIKINIVGKANINTWMGNRSPQIFIEDYEILDNQWGF